MNKKEEMVKNDVNATISLLSLSTQNQFVTNSYCCRQSEAIITGGLPSSP